MRGEKKIQKERKEATRDFWTMCRPSNKAMYHSLTHAGGRTFFFFFFFAIRCCAPVDKRKDWGLGNVLDHAQGKMYLSLRTK